MFIKPEPIGLCTQTPWLPAGAIRAVISGASGNKEAEWYDAVVRACCLETDIRALSAQDQTQIGSRGLNLSGGQRQRVVSQGHLSQSYCFQGSHGIRLSLVRCILVARCWSWTIHLVRWISRPPLASCIICLIKKGCVGRWL